MKLLLACVFCLSAFQDFSQGIKYSPTWKSLDSRPLPSWYDEAKVGIFIHWGVFSVPSFRSEWFWWYWQGTHEKDTVDFMKRNYPPGFSYADFAPMFTAELFNPDEWADIFNASGARYIVPTSKHHEGFCNWKTNVSFSWNSVDNGPHRDLMADLASSIRKRTKIRFGIYHSLFEWFNPFYLSDKRAGYKTRSFVTSKTIPELHEIVNKLKPDLIWSDGDWEASPEYWTSQQFLAWLYNDSPVKDSVVTNDRWGKGATCHHGGYFTCQDRFNPGKLFKHKWENALTLDKKSWGFRREAALSDYMSIEELLTQLASTVSCGGNLLVNVGATKAGRIPPIMEERLRQMGKWLSVNGEAIYGSRPWKHQNDSANGHVWYTASNMTVYAVVLQWPANGKLFLGSVRAAADTKFSLLGWNGQVAFVPAKDGVTLFLPLNTGLQWAWTVKMEGGKPADGRAPFYFPDFKLLNSQRKAERSREQQMSL